MVKVDSALVSTLLVPATALAVTAGPVVTQPRAVPLVHVQEIALAGIGQDIYNAITPVVQYAVGGVSYLINIIPVVGGIVAAQINIDYFQGIQPAVAATVNYAAALLHDPLDFFPITRGYIDTLVGIQYDLVSAQLRFLGFNELPPRPAGVPAPSPRVAASTAVTAAPSRSTRPARARNEARSRDRLTVRPGASAKPAAAAARPAKPDQAGGAVETRRQKSTTGRTRSAISEPTRS